MDMEQLEAIINATPAADGWNWQEAYREWHKEQRWLLWCYTLEIMYPSSGLNHPRYWAGQEVW